MNWAPVILGTHRLTAENLADLALSWGCFFPGQTGDPSLLLHSLRLVVLEVAWCVWSKELGRANFKELKSSLFSYRKQVSLRQEGEAEKLTEPQNGSGWKRPQ